jgi:membrane protein involved in colicin uptake
MIMRSTRNRLALVACFVVMGNAQAIIGVAPGGSVVRRHAVVATTAVVASSTANAAAAANANAAAAATANANAAAANANAAAAAQAAPAPAAAPAIGSMTTTLPPGCTPKTLNGVEYQLCGSTYYRAAMSGSTLVFVVSQP